MGKVAPEPLIPQRTHSGRSYWVRNILAATRDDADPTAKGVSRSNQSPPSQSPAKKRFVEPYRLSSEQRAAMLAPLAERNIGDTESRELFAAALAYDLAACYELTVANPEPDLPAAHVSTEPGAPASGVTCAKSSGRAGARPAPRNPVLHELAQAAQALALRLDALEAEERAKLLHGLREGDRFRRGYDDDYLSALRGEVLRLAAGVDAGSAHSGSAAESSRPRPPRRPAAPKPSPASRQFIARVAGAFEECFDQAPTAQVGGPFAVMLKALVAVTGVRIPTDARNLAELLKRA
jgi:hypothetical protein